MNKWDRRFFTLAKEAASWSKDPTCKVGAVLVSPGHNEFAIGYNGFPVGIKDSAELLADTKIKNAITVHAEVNAIVNARRDVAGWSMYTTKPPCLACACTIIQAGIKEVNCPELRNDSSWYNENSTAFDLLIEAGIEVYYDSKGTLVEYRHDN